MKAIIDWFGSNNLRTILVILSYYLLVILPHEWVGLTINKAFSGISRDQYNLIILVCFSALLLLMIVLLSKRLLHHPNRNKLFFFFVCTIMAMVFVNTYLFVINIESVHYVQYAIGAILIFGLLGNYFSSLFWATMIGIIDESYQYFYLAPERTDYFDFNDVITNFLGAAFGLLILKTFQLKEKRQGWSYFKKSVLWPLVFFVIFVLISLSSDLLSVFPSSDKFMLVRKMQEGFWTTVPPEVTFHVVQPLEGLLMISGLFLFYYFCFATKIVRKN